MLLDFVILGIGLVLLWKGSDYFVPTVAEIARRIGVSELVIGLTLVSACTTLPEFMASTTASYLGSSGIAVGNAVGSDITNISLILGICILVRGYTIQPGVVKRYGLILLLICFLFSFLMPGGISRIEGGILVAAFAVSMWAMSRGESAEGFKAPPKASEKPWLYVILIFVGGLVSIFLGARLLVTACLHISAAFSVLESAIGSTVVALGTSLPEFAVSLRAVTGKHEQISIGNILGANTFNLSWITGAAALINPLTFDSNLFYFNTPLMVVVTVMLLAFMRSGYTLRRWEGVIFLVIYAFFLILNLA